MSDPTEDCVDASKPYQWNGERSPIWRAAVDEWPWIDLGDDSYEKSGECPRCHHHMNVPYGGLVTGVQADVAAPGGAATEELIQMAEKQVIALHRDGEVTTFLAVCNCTEDHSNRPPGVTAGCGQIGLIAPPQEG